MADRIDKERVLAALRGVATPDGGDIVSRGLVSEIAISAGKVYFSLYAAPNEARAMENLRVAAEQAVRRLPGVSSAVVSLTSDKSAASTGGPAGPQRGIGGVKRIIAVASGKGGVGKSTTAVNIALGLRANGLEVGLLDADIYGPSAPKLMRLSGKPELIGKDTMKPLENYGLKVMSIGFMIDEDTPMIWRGPMVMSAVSQMLQNVAWGQLDALIVDMPPGTGDAQLTLAQSAPLAGAVIVSTPQDLALIDARKGLAMFRKVNVPVLGIVENMSYFLCPSCGHRSDVFGHGGARAEAERLGTPFLGEVPLHMDIREKSDAGLPPVATDPASANARIYREIAAAIWSEAEKPGATRAAPKIVIE